MMTKPGVEVSKKDFMTGSMLFYFAGRTEDKEKAAEMNDKAAKLLGFDNYQEFEEFHENID